MDYARLRALTRIERVIFISHRFTFKVPIPRTAINSKIIMNDQVQFPFPLLFSFLCPSRHFFGVIILLLNRNMFNNPDRSIIKMQSMHEGCKSGITRTILTGVTGLPYSVANLHIVIYSDIQGSYPVPNLQVRNPFIRIIIEVTLIYK